MSKINGIPIGTTLNPAKMGGGGAAGVGIEKIEQTAVGAENNGVNAITVTLTDGTEYVFEVKNGSQGDPGNGIESVVLNDDYTLTLEFTEGGSYTTPSLRGPIGAPGKGMPTVTEENEGDLACVVNGVWATITLEELAAKIQEITGGSGGEGGTGGDDGGGDSGGDDTGDTGGDEPLSGYDYSGSVTASEQTTLELNISGLDAINKNGIYLEGGGSGDYVVTKIENGVVYYQDSGSISSDGELDAEFMRGLQGENVGIKLSADAQNVNLVFDGTYTWGYKK